MCFSGIKLHSKDQKVQRGFSSCNISKQDENEKGMLRVNANGGEVEVGVLECAGVVVDVVYMSGSASRLVAPNR